MKALAKQLITAAMPRSAAVRLWSGRQYRRHERAYPFEGGRTHGLPGELIVSLTSFPPRFPTLHLTLNSLLRQQTRPDRIVLWLAHGDKERLPSAVLRLLGGGIELREVDDVRSYKKLVFALEAFPDAWIATVDDDVFYKPDWLGLLVDGLDLDGPEHDIAATGAVITCHRAHRLTQTAGGTLAPYRDWQWDAEDAAAHRPSPDLMPTGIGGILYPPGALHPEVVVRSLYEDLAPSADDLWFFWCARRAGSTYRKVGPHFEQLTWWSSQGERLFDDNITRNDAQIARLVARYGSPLAMPVGSGRAMTVA